MGGIPRDLALERAPRELAQQPAPGDLDFATVARPEQVEACFPHTVPVGRAFGTLVLPPAAYGGEHEAQITTFRSERGYSDRRRPDEVCYGATLEEDARRRDFTCNALYLDPLTDELRDPEDGLRDLGQGVLRAVGEPAERFREDGLRLVRLARFSGVLGLEIDPATLAGAREARESLAGVSPERVLQELGRIFEAPEPGRALGVLRDAGTLEGVLPGALDPARRVDWVTAAGAGPEPLSLAAGLAALLGQPAGKAGEEPARAALLRLRPSRELVRSVEQLWSCAAALASLPEQGRAARLRLLRDPAWPELRRLARAAGSADELGAVSAQRLDELDQLAASVTPDELRPAALLDSRDLLASGLARGAAWGRALAAAEELQLEGRLVDREAALAWLAARVAQEGGKTRRKP